MCEIDVVECDGKCVCEGDDVDDVGVIGGGDDDVMW